MILLIGGAYQGKLAYAKQNYPVKTVYHCSAENPNPDFSADVINGWHLLVLALQNSGQDYDTFFNQHQAALQNKIIISDDLSCGIVPIEPELRAWREAASRSQTQLAKEAETVIRLFCGIGSKLK